jgi:8-amino-3,8-dideoxy-alpha-D-manno-octulosonate transaminase
MPGPGYYWIGEEEEREVLDVVRSRHLNRYGDASDPAFKAKVVTFERMVRERFDVKHSLAVSSGTAALFVALQTLRIGPGDEVICPGYTFVASMSSVIFAGAVPVLAEVDDTLTLDPADVEARITPRTKAILAVHMLGAPAALPELVAIAERHKLYLIEDTAQAFGATLGGKALGTFGTMGTYSFNIYKTINAGDGGMVVTGDEELFHTAFGVHDQGHKPLRMGLEVGSRSIIGFNFRMNELTGAVLIAQFRKLEALLSDLRTTKRRLKAALADIKGLRFRRVLDPDGECATLLVLTLPTDSAAAAVAAELGTVTLDHSGWHVYSNMEHILAKRQLVPGPPFQSTEFPTAVEYAKDMLPQTDDILRRSINLSIGVVDSGLGSAVGVHPKADAEEIDRVASRVRAAAEKHL